MRTATTYDEFRDDRDVEIAEARQIAELRRELDDMGRIEAKWFAAGAYHLHNMATILGEGDAWRIFRQEAENRGLL